MTPEQFVYWMQGFMEMQDPKCLDEKQTQIVKDHLALVLGKVTPDREGKIKINPQFLPDSNQLLC